MQYLLLPVIEPLTKGEDVIVGTTSNLATSSKLVHIPKKAVGILLAMVPADLPTGSFLEGKDFTKVDIPALGDFFPVNSSPTNKFKLVTFPTVFPLPFGSVAIKGGLTEDSVCDALHHISETTGPLWIKLISNWSKALADLEISDPTIASFIPPLKPNQSWATNASFPSHGLTEDEEEVWKAINTITIAHTTLLSQNMTNPEAASVVVTAMLDTQSVLTADSATKDITPTKQSPTQNLSVAKADK